MGLGTWMRALGNGPRARFLSSFLAFTLLATVLIESDVWEQPSIGLLRLSAAALIWACILMLYRSPRARIVVWILAVFVPAEVVCRIVYRTYLTPGTVLSIALTNRSEASEIFGRHPEWLIIGLPYLGVVAWGLVAAPAGNNPFSLPRLKAVFLVALMGLVSGTAWAYARAPIGLDSRLTTAEADLRSAFRDSFPVDGIYSGLVIIRGEMFVMAQAAARSDFKFEGVRRQIGYSGPETYLIVIGESSRRANWSLFGYGRDTNPGLEKRRGDGLYLFNNVRSNANLTIYSLPLAMTRATPSEQWRSAKEKSIIGLANQAGFETYWLSNQGRYGIWDRQVSAIAADAQHRHFLPRASDSLADYETSYDEALLPALASILYQPAGDAKRVIFMHTMGSHFDYRLRYPPEHAVFSDPANIDAVVCCGPEQRAQTLDAYDDTVLYTDFVLSGAIDLLSKLDQPTALYYFSDHGERMFCAADPLTSFSHGFLVPSDDELNVPVLFWMSPRYRAAFPTVVAAAARNANLATSLASVFDTFADLTHIELNRIRATTSLLSPAPTSATLEVKATDGSIRSADEPNLDCNER
jgi:glucan phosphoethanolaminetransferase (alkaline phosphatase superfamily)